VDLPNLISDVRKDLSHYFPGAERLPVTVGVSGMGGFKPYSDVQCTGALDVLTDTIIPAQFSVANSTLHPEFAGTVSAVETRHFHRKAQYSPGNQCYHWNSEWRAAAELNCTYCIYMSPLTPSRALIDLWPSVLFARQL
jgi:hypothetical protein